MGSARVAVWQILYPDKHDPEAFALLFGEELESCCSANIACCDSCFDEYSRLWPGLTARHDFQSAGISLDWFFESSSLSDVYTKEEFHTLCEEMGCPVCHRPLEFNIWPFEPEFDVPVELEEQIEELNSIAFRTPFLVLQHRLAKKVLDEVRKIASIAVETAFEEAWFRARPADTPKQRSQFLAPPPSKCCEGRYNHAGRPVLYLANDAATAFCETGSPVKGVLCAKIVIQKPLMILDLSQEDLASDILKAVSVSSLLAAPAIGEGWDKAEYSFTRFVADCAIAAGLNGIKYPSIANAKGANLVLFSAELPWDEIVSVDEIAEYPASND